MKMKKVLSSSLTLATILGMTIMPVSAQEPELKIESIEADTRVGDGQREVYQFKITVNDGNLLNGIGEEDFDIINNSSTIPLDENGWVKAYEDDGIELSITDNILTMNVEPFCYTGIYREDGSFQRDAWKVVCTNEALSFDANDVTTLKTDTLDDAIRGEFTYAGLTRKYALYVPKNASGAVPLVVWNHGGGEYNGNLEDTLVANKGLTAWPEAGYETAVLQIQVANPNYSYFTAFNADKQKLIDQNNALQAALIKELINKGIVDENRVYVTGASSGGGATMRFLMQYPELFAGAIACCSMDPIVWVHYNNKDSYETIVSNFETAFQSDVYTWDEEKGDMITKKVDTQALLDVPIYFTHAQNDPTCSVNSSKAMYEAMKNLGDTNNNLIIWSDDDMGDQGIFNTSLLHWSWVKIFNETGEGTPMNWLFKQAKTTKVDTSVEESSETTKPDSTTNPNKITPSVKTGDDSAIAVMASIMMFSAGAYITIKKYAK